MVELLKAENITKTYHDGERELKVLASLNLTVERGEAVAVVGMSGAGKSTLLHILGGLDVPDEGSLTFDGEVISGQSLSKLSSFRSRQVGFVFQFHHLLPEFTALENIMIPALMIGRPRGEVRDEAMVALEHLGLADRARHRPSKLSGGEQQRVALARALINQPSLLMADEPTGNLDIHTGETVIKLLWDMTVRKNRGVIIVTHEPLIARKADRILRLFEGKLYPVSHSELEDLMPSDG